MNKIQEAIASFPATFGLKGFPGQTFSIKERSCYLSSGQIMLYTVNAKGQDFAKATPTELRKEIC